MYFDKDPDIEKIQKQAVIAFNVCERKMKELDEIIDDPVINFFFVNEYKIN